VSGFGLHVVLVRPEIPPNTGNIARLCAATRTRLHLVRPLGFSLEDRYLRRAGLDYWPFVDLVVHDDWAAFLAREAPETPIFFSTRGAASYLSAAYERPRERYLVFGAETSGLPLDILRSHSGQTFRIPIFTPHVRSLNLANAVAIVVYEALRRRSVQEVTAGT